MSKILEVNIKENFGELISRPSISSLKDFNEN